MPLVAGAVATSPLTCVCGCMVVWRAGKNFKEVAAPDPDRLTSDQKKAQKNLFGYISKNGKRIQVGLATSTRDGSRLQLDPLMPSAVSPVFHASVK